jgi:hypothetical protein
LATGIFPDRLKFSEAKPLFKKGDKTDFTNYRPISLLTSFSKITEINIYKSYINTYSEIMCWLRNNSALERNYLLIWPHRPS